MIDRTRLAMSGTLGSGIILRWQPLLHNLRFDTIRLGSHIEGVPLAAARMKNKCRAEACNTGPGVLANTRVHDAIRSFKQKFVRERLRCAVTLRNRFRLQAALSLIGLERVKLAREIGKEIDVIEAVPTFNASILENTLLCA